MKILNTLIRWHVLLSLGAVLLIMSAQVQLGLKPLWQPYLFMVFVSTFFVYNRHRLSIVFAPRKELLNGSHELARKSYFKYLVTVLIMIAGAVVAVFFTGKKVLISLIILGIFAFLYSPVSGQKMFIFSLRKIPYMKIILIALVWSATTVVLPVIQAGESIFSLQPGLLFAERFLFIFSVALQFDIRDMQADRIAQLKTIPLLIGENYAVLLSSVLLAASLFISVIHYRNDYDSSILIAICISVFSTFLIFGLYFIRKHGRYYYQILDGTLLLQGILVYGFYLVSGH